MSSADELPIPEPVPSTFEPPGMDTAKRYFDVRSAFEKLAVIKRLYRERFGHDVHEPIPPAQLGGS